MCIRDRQKASDRADEIINEANEKKLAQEREYDRVRLEVTRFKSDVLNLYLSLIHIYKTSPQELMALAEKILSGEVPPFCPHGRPCVLKLTRKELEKQFGRIV